MPRDVPALAADRPQIAIQDQQMQASNETSTRQTRLAGHERAALSALVARLRRRYGNDLRRVVLFGSKARGDFDNESDLDVLVVISMSTDMYRHYWNDIVDIACDIELKYGVVISLIIKETANYAAMRSQGLLLARNIEQDGIDLWMTPSLEQFLEVRGNGK